MNHLDFYTKEYQTIKKQYPDTILAYSDDSGLYCFDNDAIIVGGIVNIWPDNDILEIPANDLDQKYKILKSIIESGLHIALIESVIIPPIQPEKKKREVRSN